MLTAEGADDYVTKPFSTPGLLARVRWHCGHRRDPVSHVYASHVRKKLDDDPAHPYLVTEP